MSLFGAPEQKKIVVFDLETQKSFEEVGGRNRMRDLKVSVAVTQKLPEKTFHVYYEKELASLVDELFAADLVVGFNIRRFDYEVLSAYTDRPLKDLPTLDLLEEVERTLGFRVKLDNLTRATLGAKKSADGLAAIRWYKEGNLAKIAEYCQEDVRITAELYQYGKTHRQVLFPDRSGAVKTCAVRW